MVDNAKKPEKPVKLVINNTELVTRFRAEGGGIFHIRPEKPQDRGITVAFKLKNSRVTFATAVQHRDDSFTKKIGTKTAIEHFDAGQVVTVPRKSKTLAGTLQGLAWGLSLL